MALTLQYITENEWRQWLDEEAEKALTNDQQELVEQAEATTIQHIKLLLRARYQAVDQLFEETGTDRDSLLIDCVAKGMLHHIYTAIHEDRLSPQGVYSQWMAAQTMLREIAQGKLDPGWAKYQDENGEDINRTWRFRIGQTDTQNDTW